MLGCSLTALENRKGAVMGPATAIAVGDALVSSGAVACLGSATTLLSMKSYLVRSKIGLSMSNRNGNQGRVTAVEGADEEHAVPRHVGCLLTACDACGVSSPTLLDSTATPHAHGVKK
jgi:hypothetical protein